MPRMGGINGDRIIAALVVLGAHLLFWWILTRATTIFAPPVATGTTATLQVTWVDPQPPAKPVTPIVSASPSSPARRPHNRDPDAQAAARIDATQEPVASPPSSMSAVFIEQGRRQFEPQDDGEDFVRDPLANRNARLPGKQADTFRMRDPISPQAVLRRIGKVFGGAGYTTDPCPQIRENIAGLAPGGDGERLQEELRRQRAYCH